MTSHTTRLAVRESGRPLYYCLEDITRYHGYGYPGGVAHAFKAMELALPLLDPAGPPERREIWIDTPFKGPGARDAFEMVTRCVTGTRYRVDSAFMKPERGSTLQAYVFIFTYRHTTVSLQIRDGHVRDEFIRLGRQEERSVQEEVWLAWLKQEMADRLLAAPATDVYELIAPAN